MRTARRKSSVCAERGCKPLSLCTDPALDLNAGIPTWRIRWYLGLFSLQSLLVILADRTIFDSAAMVIFFGFSAFSLITTDVAGAIYHLLRAARRVGEDIKRNAFGRRLV